MRRPTAILISGRGSNMVALVEAAANPAYPAEIVLVISDNPDAPGLQKATAAGIAVAVVDRKAAGSKAVFEAQVQERLETVGAELICLAGFMRLLSPEFVERWRDRILNVHPSLLPAFPGLNTHARALASGVRVHGCTIHFVRAAMDDGPIISQAVVPVLPNDTEETLSMRLLGAEHQVYPHSLALVAAGAARVINERVVVDGSVPNETPLFSPPL